MYLSVAIESVCQTRNFLSNADSEGWCKEFFCCWNAAGKNSVGQPGKMRPRNHCFEIKWDKTWDKIWSPHRMHKWIREWMSTSFHLSPTSTKAFMLRIQVWILRKCLLQSHYLWSLRKINSGTIVDYLPSDKKYRLLNELWKNALTDVTQTRSSLVYLVLVENPAIKLIQSVFSRMNLI